MTYSVLYILITFVILFCIHKKFDVGITRTIKKGKHWPTKICFPYFVKLKKDFTLSTTISFSYSCLYDFHDIDEYDRNKLFGISFVLFPRIRTKSWLYDRTSAGVTVLPWFQICGLVIIKPMHWNSVRFTWNTVNKENKIDIWPYVYKNGERLHGMASMGTCDIDTYYKFTLDIDRQDDIDDVIFTKSKEDGTDKETCNHPIHDSGIFYMRLGLYFGGNKSAPHTMTILQKY